MHLRIVTVVGVRGPAAAAAALVRPTEGKEALVPAPDLSRAPPVQMARECSPAAPEPAGGDRLR